MKRRQYRVEYQFPALVSFNGFSTAISILIVNLLMCLQVLFITIYFITILRLKFATF